MKEGKRRDRPVVRLRKEGRKEGRKMGMKEGM